MAEAAHQDIAHRATIESLVATYQVAASDIRAAFAQVHEAEKRLNAAFTMADWHGIHIACDGGSHRYGRWDEADGVIAQLERQIWRAIVDRLELRRMMSVKAWTEMERHLERETLPPLTVENAVAMANGMLGRLPEMLAEAVEEVFQWLRPPRSDYKTNTELEVGRKAILTYTVERAWSGGGFKPTYHSEPRLTALENVFTALDGRGQISKEHYSVLSRAIKEAPEGHGQTDLFAFRAYRNGNLHLEFLRLDLLQRFNAIAGGKRLRPEGSAPTIRPRKSA